MHIWYIYDKQNKIIAYTQDFRFAIELEDAGFIVKQKDINE